MLPWQLDEKSSSFFTIDFMLVNIYLISSNENDLNHLNQLNVLVN